jgi:hypothetical protein
MGVRDVLLALATSWFLACGRFGYEAAAGNDAPLATTHAIFDRITMGGCSASPCTFTHNVGPGATGMILIWYFCSNGSAPTSALTVDGVAAVFVGTATFTNQRGELWYALTATSATHAISAAYGCTGAFIVTTSATGVDPVDPIRSTRFDGTELTTPSITDVISSAPNDLVIDGVCHGDAIDPPTPPQVGQYLQNLSGADTCGSFAGSTQPGASPSVTTSWIGSGIDYWAYMAASIRSAGSP